MNCNYPIVAAFEPAHGRKERLGDINCTKESSLVICPEATYHHVLKSEAHSAVFVVQRCVDNSVLSLHDSFGFFVRRLSKALTPVFLGSFRPHSFAKNCHRCKTKWPGRLDGWLCRRDDLYECTMSAVCCFIFRPEGVLKTRSCFSWSGPRWAVIGAASTPAELSIHTSTFVEKTYEKFMCGRTLSSLVVNKVLQVFNNNRRHSS